MLAKDFIFLMLNPLLVALEDLLKPRVIRFYRIPFTNEQIRLNFFVHKISFDYINI